MESREIELLLEKYWQAETSLEEEEILSAYFRGPEVTAALEQYRSLFDWIDEEAEVKASPELADRILQEVTRMEEGKVLPLAGPYGEFRQLRQSGGWGMRYVVAAALVLCLIGVFLAAKMGETDGSALSAAGPIKDTYDDPEKALAVVRQALLKVSSRMNEGRQITQKNMQLMDHSWEAAVSN